LEGKLDEEWASSVHGDSKKSMNASGASISDCFSNWHGLVRDNDILMNLTLLSCIDIANLMTRKFANKSFVFASQNSYNTLVKES
jgi:hypothetical protein